MENYKSIFKEMALIDKAKFFINMVAIAENSIGEKGFKSESGEGWDSLTQYYKSLKTSYTKRSYDTTFSKWFHGEISMIYSEDWEKLEKQVQDTMIALFQELDKDPKILDRKEIRKKS